MITPEGLPVAVIGQGGLVGASDHVSADSNDWQKLTISFVAPANLPAATLAVVRTPGVSYEGPTSE
ncbi:MAG TPA: hypothetical protein VFS27_09530 [Blastocatellia bacterium]|nr:hypothetical protein [Blastocatellia bacterium]